MRHSSSLFFFFFHSFASCFQALLDENSQATEHPAILVSSWENCFPQFNPLDHPDQYPNASQVAANKTTRPFCLPYVSPMYNYNSTTHPECSIHLNMLHGKYLLRYCRLIWVDKEEHVTSIRQKLVDDTCNKDAKTLQTSFHTTLVRKKRCNGEHQSDNGTIVLK